MENILDSASALNTTQLEALLSGNFESDSPDDVDVSLSPCLMPPATRRRPASKRTRLQSSYNIFNNTTTVNDDMKDFDTTTYRTIKKAVEDDTPPLVEEDTPELILPVNNNSIINSINNNSIINSSNNNSINNNNINNNNNNNNNNINNNSGTDQIDDARPGSSKDPQPVDDETISDEESDSDAEKENEQPKKANKNAKQNYLLTLSQVNTTLFPNREDFAEFVLRHFRHKDDESDIICKWAVSAEPHLKTKSFHYHMALGLNYQRRWCQIAANMRSELKGTKQVVDFRECGGSYYSVFTYVSKMDAHMIVSPGNEGLLNPVPSRTEKAIQGKRARGNSGSGNGSAKKTKTAKQWKEPRLDLEVLQALVVDNKLRTEKALAAFARKLARDGKKDLQLWLLRHPSSKSRNDMLNTIWMMEDADDLAERNSKSYIELLTEARSWDHSVKEREKKTCDGSWMTAAMDIFSKNNVDPAYFAKRVLRALSNGRGKGFNFMICGPSNCAKSFLLMPLKLIFSCFWQPSDGSYNWVVAPEKEVIFLNDIRYEEDGDTKVMPWRQFLNLLEGCPVNIARPSNHHANDYEWDDTKAPILATAEFPISRIKNGRIDQGETQQMAERWGEILYLKHQYLGPNVNYNLIPCARCFAELVLSYGQDTE